jgi:hypothetical protein
MPSNLPQQPSPQQVKSSLDTTAMREAVLEQVQKDLEWEVDGLDCKDIEFFDKLLAKLAAYFSKLIDNQPSNLAQIVYRVDINEAKLKRVLAEPHASSAIIFAQMTLQRIMLKVFYRNVYNGTIKF